VHRREDAADLVLHREQSQRTFTVAADTVGEHRELLFVGELRAVAVDRSVLPIRVLPTESVGAYDVQRHELRY
jgi:hypothetical protein